MIWSYFLFVEPIHYLNSNKKLGNNQWESVYKQDYIINEGDVILLKNVFINDKSLSGSILINEDQVIEIEFGYYYINGFQAFQYIPRQMYPVSTDSTITPNYNLYWYDASHNHLPDGPLQNNYIYLDGIYPPSYSYQQEPAGGWPQFNFPYDFKPYVFHKIENNEYTLIKNKVQCLIEKGSYSPSQLASILTQKLSSVNNNMSITVYDSSGNKTRTNTLYSGSNLLVGIQSLTDDNIFIGSYVNQYDASGNLDLSRYPQFMIQTEPYQDLFIGAQEFAIDYNLETQSFQFSYMHSPMYAGASNTTGVPSVVFTRIARGFDDGTLVDFFLSDLFTQTKNSGIFITDLQPSNFWENLGFNLSDIIVNTENGIDTGEILSKTTDQQMPLSSVFAGSQFTNAYNTNQVVKFFHHLF